MITELTIRLLQPESDDLWQAFVDLLTLADLPTSDLSGGARFFAVEDERGLFGFGGLEGLGPDQLIRSVTMAPGLRRRGLGPVLVGQLMRQAKSEGAERLWLLTTEADQFFADQGWEAVPRDSAPEVVRSTHLYEDLCPATAVLMVRSLR